MTKTEINEQDFDWIYSLIMKGAPRAVKKLSYKKLISHLHELEFYYVVPMDSNRLEDGIDLRYRFGHETGVQEFIVSLYLDNRTCSILEMMTALAIRCEEQFMSRKDELDNAGEWFWHMLESLELLDMTDNKYDESIVDQTIKRFLDREYEPDGRGGLFYIKGCEKDLRTIEIWYQLNWYLQSKCKF